MVKGSRIERQLAAEYTEKYRFIADTLRFRQVVKPQEIDAYLPGGEKNKATDLRGVIFAYASMVRLCERLPDGENDGPIDSSLLDDALLDSPEVIQLPGDKEISVYPKSFHALRFIEGCDRRVQWLVEKRALLQSAPSTDELDLLERVTVEAEHQYRLIAWSATHSEPGLPFADDEIPIGVPDSIRDLSPTDYMLLRQGFIRVNALRLALLVKMLSDQTGSAPSDRDSWSTFFASQEVEGRGPARHLMRDRSLVSQLAAALKVGEVRKRQEEEAKRKDGAA